MEEPSWMVPIKVMFHALNHKEVQACSIFNVPEELREANEDAYKPKHISIGPLHKGATRHLHLMEEPKWRYMREFLDRKPEKDRSSENRLTECGVDILNLNNVICASYGGSNNNIVQETNSHEITKIMIVDGCFLLELLMKLDDYINNPTTYNKDSILETEEKIISVLNDIAMLENQIPFVVLKRLFRKVFRDPCRIEDDHRVAEYVCKAFGYEFVRNTLVRSSGVAHILNLMHLFTVEQSSQDEGKKAKLELLRCATQLHASGVIIQGKSNSTNQNKHNLVDVFDFNICFNDCKLDIPPLYIKETTEVKWRNLIAWEQSKIGIPSKYTSYALFFNGLICCEHDIEFLNKKGVIINKMNKSNEDLLALFRTISKGAEQMDSSYSEICKRLNVYHYKGKKVTKMLQKWPIHVWHQCRRIFDIIVYYGRKRYNILIHDHMPTVWKFIGIVAAALLLVLTIMQTYYSSRSH
ncbi:unnamed protein product [Trifolium pratense]|uniref:Uncharacterized protein n=1 Tax=Trifolium pratense TaxID=57577 RepID=A0ACB0J5P3_TRIPR|nr:unnamed protein product [Trifolium pratense]